MRPYDLLAYSALQQGQKYASAVVSAYTKLQSAWPQVTDLLALVGRQDHHDDLTGVSVGAGATLGSAATVYARLGTRRASSPLVQEMATVLGQPVLAQAELGGPSTIVCFTYQVILTDPRVELVFRGYIPADCHVEEREVLVPETVEVVRELVYDGHEHGGEA